MLLTASVLLSACADNASFTTSDLNLSFSDAPVISAEEVVITVESIAFRGIGEGIVVDKFTSEDLELQDTNTFKLDLVTIQGENRRLVIDTVKLPVGEYYNMLVNVIYEDTWMSYVTEIGGATKALKVTSDQLKLDAFTINRLSKQSMVV